MRATKGILLPVLVLAVPCSALAATNLTHRSAHASLHHVARRGVHNSIRHEAIGMPSERATEIQTALIKQGYLTGEPTGVWDASSVAAMQKLQSDNGWQTKITPDSRALIKLGLGPQQQTALVTTPQP